MENPRKRTTVATAAGGDGRDMPTKSRSRRLSEHCCRNLSGSAIPRIYAKCSRTFSSRFPNPGKQRREEYLRYRPPKARCCQLEIRSLRQSLCASDFIKEEQRNQQDMSNTSNKTSKSSETYSRKTLAEQEEAFWLLGNVCIDERQGRHHRASGALLEAPGPVVKRFRIFAGSAAMSEGPVRT